MSTLSRRQSSLGSGRDASGAGAFSREAVLQEATRLRVAPEDKATLETLARLAFARPGFRAVIKVRLGDDRSSESTFEVLHADGDAVVRPMREGADADTAATATPGQPVETEETEETEPLDTGLLDELTESGLEELDEFDLASPLEQDGVLSAARLGALLEDVATQSPDYMAVFSPTGRKLYWANESFDAAFRRQPDMTLALMAILDDWSQGRFVVQVLPTVLDQGWWSGRLAVLTGDTPIAVSAVLMAHRNERGQIASLSFTARPTAEPTASADHAFGEGEFAALVEHVSDLILVMDADGTVTFASSAAQRMIDLDPSGGSATNLLDLLHPDDMVESLRELVAVDADGHGLPVTIRLQGPGGWRRLQAVVTDLTDNPAIDAFSLTASDVTERAEEADALGALAYSDPDTGLPNRLRLLDRLNAVLTDPTGKRSAALLLVDLDHFRQTNEIHGTAKADAFLAEAARRLVKASGDDAIVARLRSDEFAVALPDVDDPAVAARAADALRVVLARPYKCNGATLKVTASVGVALGTAGQDPDQLLHRADHAAIQAKVDGRNRVHVWGDEATERETRRRDVERRLLEVLGDEGLPTHYQPIVDVRSGSIVGVEALLRVRNEQGALVSPAEVIEAAESTGLITQLGSRVLHATCEQLAVWGAQLLTDAPHHVSVNVSPRQLVDPALGAHVLAALSSSGLEPERLWVEVTESTLVGSDDAVSVAIAFLRDLGIKVGLDEFGAGYSTLSHLKRLSLDFLKIDRSLIGGLGTDQRDTAIVRATMELAHSLGLTVVAVGVETEEQLEMLRSLGCDQAQGYLFSPPLEPDEFAERAHKL
jgi:diguanylate cyclase (GGDEF)-like protein/PAS domain S-box-containing protein